MIESRLPIRFEPQLLLIRDPIAQLLLLVCLWIYLESFEMYEEKLWESTNCHFFRGNLLGMTRLAVKLVVTIEQFFD